MFYVFFFFSSRRRHTRLQGVWSSDVCSSDLCQRIRMTLSRGFSSAGIVFSYGPANKILYQFPEKYSVNPGWEDRKSTRLNSSHLVISYAVFCLKKKKKRKNTFYT